MTNESGQILTRPLKFLCSRADIFEVTVPAQALPPNAAKVQAGMRFVARQPILTQEQKVLGYELLFRDGVQNVFCSTDHDAAARSTLDSSLLVGFEELCDGHYAFINCTRDVLLKDYVTLLPRNLTVVEVLETVPPDDLVVAACERLKQAGYLIALDDFAIGDLRERLVPLADFIKVDIRATGPEQCVAMMKSYGHRGIRMLAEKVETGQELKAVRDMGFQYFQGFFFSRPELMRAREIPACQMNYLRMLQAVSQPILDPREIEKLIKGEASICYRLLRYLNSANFAFTSEIKSVRHALAMLGERETRRWVRLVATLGGGQNKSGQLVRMALQRARFCELLSPRIQHKGSDLFFMGLLSLMDAILEIPIAEVLEKVSVDQHTKSVLLGETCPLQPLYQLMVAWEVGDWDYTVELIRRLGLNESDVAEAHWLAEQWAKQVSGA